MIFFLIKRLELYQVQTKILYTCVADYEHTYHIYVTLNKEGGRTYLTSWCQQTSHVSLRANK